MITSIISQDDVFDEIWSIFDSNGNPVNITIFNGSASGPIVYRNEIKNVLDQNKTMSAEDVYLNIINRISTIRYYINNNYIIKIDSEAIQDRSTANKLLDQYKIQVDNIFTGTVGTKNLENSVLRSLSPTHKKNKSNRNFSKKLQAITKVGDEADQAAANALFAPDDLALQIGWLSFGSENSDPNNIRLGPDNISIVDFNNVEQTNTIRSDTDISIKTSNGQLGVEIDLIFPNVRAINGTIIDEKGNTKGAAGFRDLFGLLRMAPMVPVGGKAINMALVNHITSSGLYNELRRLYFENKINDENLFQDANELLGDPFKIGFRALSQLIRDERSTYDLLRGLLKKESDKNNLKKQDPSQKVNKKDLVDSLSNHGILLSLVCTNITVSTISSAVGAIRVRLSFQKFHSPYEDGRGLMFIDEDGNPTYNISKCYPLRNAVRSVFLSPKRASLTSKSNLQYNFNEHYIPAIGDETKYNTKFLSGYNTEEVERKFRVNEEGFTEYRTVEQDNLLPDSSKFSPILFRFSPPSATNKIYEYAPSDMVLQNVSWSYQNKIATFPVEGQIYPGFQHMGRSTVIGNLTFNTVSKEAVQKFYTLKALIDQHAKNETVSNLLRREFLDIYNDILLLSGTTRWIISVVKFSTSPDNPNLYQISLEIMSNMESVHKREKLKFETKRPSLATVIGFWDYLYDGLVAAYKKASPKQDIGGRERGYKYSDSELDNIWKLVFGTNKGNQFNEGILERNIFLAAILNQIKRGKANTDAYKMSDLYPEEFKLNPNNPLGDINNVGSFFSKIFELSTIGNKSLEDQVLKLNNGSTSQDLVDIGNVFERLAKFYENKDNKNINNPFAVSPWFITRSSNVQVKLLETIAENMGSGGFFSYPTSVKDSLTSTNKFSEYSEMTWIPTRELWNSVWRVIGPEFKSQKDENGLAYKIQDSNGPDNRVFQISQGFKTMRGQMEEIVSNPEYRAYFPSFWTKIGRSADDFVDTLSLYDAKEFKPNEYLINVDQFELNNNYIDLPMPKYFEVFGEDLKDGKPPIPRLINGHEVWRKVAPTFLELGVKPDIYSSLSTLINNDTVSPELPELMTPRSFFDYCDPGFFYSKKSWLVDEYYNILNNIDVNGNRDGFDLSPEDKQELMALDGTSEIIIDRVDIRSMVKPSDSIEKVGPRTVGVREIDRGKITELIADQISQDLYDKLSFPTIAKNNDISKLEELARQAGNISTKNGIRGKVHIIDATGKKVGVIVANQGATSGNMIELKKIGDIAQLKERIPKDIKFYFIDLTDQQYMAKDPTKVVYRDHQGVIEQNMYKGGDIRKLYKDTLMNIGDLTANYLRAYPTFKLYFVREKVQDDILITTLEDDMYGYSSVIDINITIDKDDAPVARVTLTDIAGNLSYAEFESDQYSVTDETEEVRDTISNDFGYKSPDKIKLDVGTNIVIKMGYGNNPDTLKTVFTGAIAEIEPGVITTIVAQGYKSELFRQVNLYTGRSFSEHLLKQLIDKKDISGANPNALIYKVLETLAHTPTLSLHPSAGGLPHLGHYISFNDYINANNTIKGYFNDPYQKTRDENIEQGRATSFIAGGTSIVSGLLLAKLGSRKLGYGLIGAGIADAGFGGSSKLRNFLQRYSNEFMHTNIMRNVFITNDATKEGFFNTMFQSWIADGDGWNCLKEISRYKVGYITDIVPYGNAATLFVGKPEQPYHYKPVSGRELAKFSLAQPFGQRIVFNKAFDNIISKFISSEEYGYKNISGKLSIDDKGFINGWNTSNVDGRIMSIDEYVTSKIQEIKSEANKFDPPKPVDAVLINRAFSQIASSSSIKELGSFSVFKYLLNKINAVKTIKSPYSRPQYVKFDNKALSNLFKTKVIDDSPVSDEQVSVTFKESPDETIILIKKSEGDYRKYLRDLSKDDVFVTEDTLYEKGYDNNDLYWGLKLDGTSVSRHELFEQYKIDPITGKPRYVVDAQNAQYINDRSLASQHIDLFPFHNDFVFATKVGIGRLRGSNLTFASSNDDYIKESNVIKTKDFTLYCKASEDLENIKKYGPHMIKLLFATYFGLMWTKDGDNVKLFAIEQDSVLDSLAEKYTEALLHGATLGETEDTASSLYYNSIADPVDGILSHLVGHPTLNKYKDVRREPRSIDPTTLGLVNTIFESELQNMVLNGSIRKEQVETAKSRFKIFTQLAALGNLTAKYIEGVNNTNQIVEKALQFSTVGLQTANDPISNFDLLNLNIYNAVDNLDQVSRSALTKLIGLPENAPFDSNNVEHLISLRTKLNGLNLNDTTFNNLPLSQSEREALTTLLKDTNRDSKLNLDAINNIDNINTSAPIALGVDDNKTLYQILIENADQYKGFLLFFSKWLQNNFTEDKALIDHRVNSAILNKLGDKYEPGVKRFEDVHYIVSGFDIIENNITATMSQMANNVLLMTPTEIEVVAQNDENSPEPIWKIDEYRTKYIPYPNYQYSGIDWNPYVRPELRKQRTVVERNARTDEQRLALLINHMAEAIRPMYRGHLKIIGRVIKPYDKIVLFDATNEIFGLIEVEHVTHSFDADNGWTTTIVPCAYVNPMEPSAGLQKAFDTSNITTMLKSLKVFDWVLDVFFWAGIILAPFSGGTSVAASAGSAAVKQSLKASMLNTLKSWFAKQAKAGLSAGAKAGSAALNKVAGQYSVGLTNLLKSLRAGITSNVGPLNWKALAEVSIDSFVGARSLRYLAANTISDAVKFGAKIALNVHADMTMKSGTLPIHTYCLTRFGRPIQSGLDMQKTTWYSFSERVEFNAKSASDKILQFIDEAVTFKTDNIDSRKTIYTNLEDR